jgi:hypothetical protein
MSRALLPVTFFCLFFLCCTNKDKVPANILPKDKMQALIWDLVQVDAYNKQYLSKDSIKKKELSLETMEWYDEVFRFHHTSRAEFDKSYRFYLSNPALLKQILDSATVMANRRQNEALKVPPAGSHPPLPKPATPNPIKKPSTPIPGIPFRKGPPGRGTLPAVRN